MSESRSSFLPNYLRARSPQGLRRLMLLNNIKRGLQVSYFNIQFVNGYWFAWYNIEVDFNENFKETKSDKSDE
jgi:hypothetical protein